MRRELIRYRPSLWGFAKNLRRHGVATSMKLHKTFEAALGAPQGQMVSLGLVYSIPCKHFPKVYICETGMWNWYVKLVCETDMWNWYGVREKEHMKDVKQLEVVNYTRAKKRELQTEHHQSALTDCVAVTSQRLRLEWKRYPRGSLHQEDRVSCHQSWQVAPPFPKSVFQVAPVRRPTWWWLSEPLRMMTDLTLKLICW